MAHIPYHPAPGFGDLLPGDFVVPQNPIRDAGTVLVPSVQAMTGGRTVRVPHLAELLPATMVVPQNPIRDAMASGARAGAGMPGMSSCAGCAGCGAGCGMGELGDLGDLSLTLQQPYLGVPLWVLLAGGAGVWWFMKKRRPRG
jgi:hypothetical protein